MSDMLSSKLAAQYLGVNSRTLWRWSKSNIIRPHVAPNGNYLFDMPSLDKLKKDLETTSVADLYIQANSVSVDGEKPARFEKITLENLEYTIGAPCHLKQMHSLCVLQPDNRFSNPVSVIVTAGQEPKSLTIEIAGAQTKYLVTIKNIRYCSKEGIVRIPVEDLEITVSL